MEGPTTSEQQTGWRDTRWLASLKFRPFSSVISPLFTHSWTVTITLHESIKEIKLVNTSLWMPRPCPPSFRLPPAQLCEGKRKVKFQGDSVSLLLGAPAFATTEQSVLVALMRDGGAEREDSSLESQAKQECWISCRHHHRVWVGEGYYLPQDFFRVCFCMGSTQVL